jgi:hypothetical protein
VGLFVLAEGGQVDGQTVRDGEGRRVVVTEGPTCLFVGALVDAAGLIVLMQ